MSDALQTEWAAITAANPGYTTEQKRTILNALTVPGPNQDVPVSAVVAFLEAEGVYAQFFAYCAAALAKLEAGGTLTTAQQAAANWAAFVATPGLSSIETSNGTVYAEVSAMLSAIATDAASGLTSTIVTQLLALAATTALWWRQNGFSQPVTLGDLADDGLS